MKLTIIRNTPEPPPVAGARWIPLTQGKFALVDEADYEWLNQWNWQLSNGYAVRSRRIPKGKRQAIYMHRVVCNAPIGTEVDHLDSDGLNNRRSNLRIATTSQNQRNRGPAGNEHIYVQRCFVS